MATKSASSAPGCSRDGRVRHRPARRMRLLLPIVLGCCIAIAHGTIEQMMIAPIEVIEEWGCYDTEIRLTCGNLESKIAILEARFTPHCQDQRNCVYMDENSVTHPFAAQKVDKLILEETEAGRRFLATLRRNHEKEMMEAAGGESQLSTAGRSGAGEGGTVVAARSLAAKDKRSSLRATLEHLIVRYLRRLTAPGDDEEGNGEGNEEAARYRRQSPAADGALSGAGLRPTSDDGAQTEAGTGVISNSMEITLLTNDTDTNLTDAWDGSEQQQWQQLKDSGNGYGFSGSSVSGQSWDKGAELAHESGARRDTGWDRDAGASAGEERVPHGAGGGAGGGGGGGSDHGSLGEDAVGPGRGAANGRQRADVSATRDKLRDGDGDGMPSGAHGDGEAGGAGPVKSPGSGGGLRRQKQRECGSVRKRVSQLDRFELERSMRNGSFREYNIRNALNYRCSGKNHCSFVFAQDHPFAVVWKEGSVRIKYICMEDFRISKYCGGHLIVGNEVHPEPLDGDDEEDDDDDDDGGGGNDNGDDGTRNRNTADRSHGGIYAGSPPPSWQHPKADPTLDGAANGFANDARWHGTGENDAGGEDVRTGSTVERNGGGSLYRRTARAGEPRAEALQAATVHSFHNLKILKPIDVPELPHQQQQYPQQQHELQQNDTDERNPDTEAGRNRNRQRQKVFSQDFRVLKILPSNLDVVEDIKQIGNEYYFKKDVEIVVDDSENEIVEGRREQPVVMVDSDGEQQQRGGVDYSTGTTSDGSEQTETLDIVVLPAPTKDVEIYDTELLPTEAATPGPEGDISVIGLITPTRMGTTVSTTSAAIEGPSMSPEAAVVETTLGHWDEAGLDLPEQERPSNRTADIGVETDTDGTPFSFNNRTFQSIQDTVRRQEFDESQGPYPPLGNYDEEDDEDDDDDTEADDLEEAGRARGFGFATTDHDSEGSLDMPHKKYLSVQRTQLRHPLRQGFLMTPSYPKYYIGESVCRWTLHAGLHQRIKLTVLDLALRYDDECRDYLQVVDLNTNRTLFHSCTESNRLIEIVSIQERLEVAIHTTTKVIYPKRGVLIHYTALGCEVPSPTPGHMQLVRRTEHRAKFVCDPLYVFPDTGESSRELICTAKHTWNRPLPACIEKRATEGSGLVSHYEQTRRFGDIDSMSDKQADTVYDILIPSFIIAGLFIVNGIVFAVIMRYRNKRKQRLDLESKELAEL